MPGAGWPALVLFLLFLQAPGGRLLPCDGRTEHRVDQETYVGLTDRVFVYVPDIKSAGAKGWQPFTLYVLMSDYRRPLLLDRAMLNERDFKQILASRNDIRTTAMAVTERCTQPRAGDGQERRAA